MTSIPQLRKDINDLQAENRRLKDELAAEKSKPAEVKEVVKEVPKIVTKVVEKEIPPRVVTKVVEKPVPGPERIIYRDVPGPVQYRDNPRHIAMIRKLQGRE